MFAWIKNYLRRRRERKLITEVVTKSAYEMATLAMQGRSVDEIMDGVKVAVSGHDEDYCKSKEQEIIAAFRKMAVALVNAFEAGKPIHPDRAQTLANKHIPHG